MGMLAAFVVASLSLAPTVTSAERKGPDPMAVLADFGRERCCVPEYRDAASLTGGR